MINLEDAATYSLLRSTSAFQFAHCSNSVKIMDFSVSQILRENNAFDFQVWNTTILKKEGVKNLLFDNFGLNKWGNTTKIKKFRAS